MIDFDKIDDLSFMIDDSDSKKLKKGKKLWQEKYQEIQTHQKKQVNRKKQV
jgi:hypothetical protein